MSLRRNPFLTEPIAGRWAPNSGRGGGKEALARVTERGHGAAQNHGGTTTQQNQITSGERHRERERGGRKGRDQAARLDMQARPGY